jgi:hypothetical protein
MTTILILSLFLIFVWAITEGRDLSEKRRKKEGQDELQRLKQMNEFYKRET